MLTFIIWLIGVIICIKFIKDVWSRQNVDVVVKVLLTAGLLAFSWIGLAIYYFIIKDRL